MLLTQYWAVISCCVCPRSHARRETCAREHAWAHCARGTHRADDIKLHERVLTHGRAGKAQVEVGQVAARGLARADARRRCHARECRASAQVGAGRARGALVGKARARGRGGRAAHSGQLGRARCTATPPMPSVRVVSPCTRARARTNAGAGVARADKAKDTPTTGGAARTERLGIAVRARARCRPSHRTIEPLCDEPGKPSVGVKPPRARAHPYRGTG
jgi:hypothetical protein